MTTKLVSIKDTVTEDGCKKLVLKRKDAKNNVYTVTALKEKKGPNWKMWGASEDVMHDCVADIERKWDKEIFGGG